MNSVQPGQTLGPYRIIQQIGQGGMATVYKAYHVGMDRYVAIKVLPSQFTQSPESLGRFQQEARTIANLEHLHILPVYDSGESDGVPYLVMRYLDAGTLKDLLSAGPLAQPDIDRIFTQLADALGYAHARGVIHRDIKPSNVLLDARGDVFLTDFGVAKLLEGTSQFTVSGAVTGTPAYMSPEQAQGEKLDQRSDIYSLGIVLYEMVTGHVPFEAETPLAVLLKHLSEPLPLPSHIKPGISPAIERVVLKALAKNRADRFTSCAEFLAAWTKALSGAQENASGMALTTAEPGRVADAHTPSVVETITHRRLTVRPLAVLGAGVAFVLLASLIIVITQLNQSNAPKLIPPPTVTRAAQSASIATLPVPTATSLLASATRAPAIAATPAIVQPTTDPVLLLLQKVDEPWSRGDWPQVIDLLTQARKLDARNESVVGKLYVAYYNYGRALLDQGKKSEAIQQFQNAQTVKPDGVEAQQAMLSLTPTAVPIPTCPNIGGPFAKIWSLVQQTIGCAVGDAITGFVAEENFEGGKMFWREPIDVNQVLAIYNGGTWRAFQSPQWIEGRQEFSCPSANTPARCPPTPKRGFGQAWCDLSTGLRLQLGNATDCERGYEAAMQRFGNGFMLQTDRRVIYILYSSGRWETK